MTTPNCLRLIMHTCNSSRERTAHIQRVWIDKFNFRQSKLETGNDNINSMQFVSLLIAVWSTDDKCMGTFWPHKLVDMFDMNFHLMFFISYGSSLRALGNIENSQRFVIAPVASLDFFRIDFKLFESLRRGGLLSAFQFELLCHNPFMVLTEVRLLFLVFSLPSLGVFFLSQSPLHPPPLYPLLFSLSLSLSHSICLLSLQLSSSFSVGVSISIRFPFSLCVWNSLSLWHQVRTFFRISLLIKSMQLQVLPSKVITPVIPYVMLYSLMI